MNLERWGDSAESVALDNILEWKWQMESLLSERGKAELADRRYRLASGVRYATHPLCVGDGRL